MIDKIKSMIGRKFVVLALSVPLLVLGYIGPREFLIISLAYMGSNLGEHFLASRSPQATHKAVINKEAIDV